MEVAPGIFRFGSRRVNWYVVEDGPALTLVDAGMPGHWDQLERAVDARGRSVADVAAVVLTHAHIDHVGFANRARRASRAGVHVHRADDGTARKFPPLYAYWRPTSWPFLVEGLRNRLLLTGAVQDPVAFGDGDVLDVPGRPAVIHVPGHTAGSCALHLPDRGVLFTGDGLVTLDPYTARTGPRLVYDPVNEDTAQARRSLTRLADLDVPLLLPGHGEPWTHGAAAAVEHALRADPG